MTIKKGGYTKNLEDIKNMLQDFASTLEKALAKKDGISIIESKEFNGEEWVKVKDISEADSSTVIHVTVDKPDHFKLDFGDVVFHTTLKKFGIYLRDSYLTEGEIRVLAKIYKDQNDLDIVLWERGKCIKSMSVISKVFKEIYDKLKGDVFKSWRCYEVQKV